MLFGSPAANGSAPSNARRKLSVGALSVTGNVRENNEDRVHVDEQGRFFLVADGMGGQSAGEKASEMAIELISKRIPQLIDFSETDDAIAAKSAIDQAVQQANGEIMALSEIDADFHNMGTTLAVVVRRDDVVYIGGVGDSRIYRLRNGELSCLTVDHSLPRALLDAGVITADEARDHRYKNVLYRYLGTKEGGTGVDARREELQPGDRFLLCSDGVTDRLSDDALRDLLGTVDLAQSIAEKIVQAALDAGSRDNVSCVVIAVD